MTLREELARAYAVPLLSFIDLLGDRDIVTQDKNGEPVIVRFGKGGSLGSIDSVTGLPLGPGHVGVTGKAEPSLDEVIDRLNRRAGGLFSVRRGR